MLASAREVPLLELCNITNKVFRDTPAPLRFTQASFECYLKRMDINLLVSRVYMHEGRPAGVALMAIRQQRAHLCAMGLVPEHRNQGKGAALLSSTLQAVPGHTVTLDVAARNLAAVALYKSHGFHAVARHMFWYVCLPIALKSEWKVMSVTPELALNYTRSVTHPWAAQNETLSRDLEGKRGAVVLYRQHVRGAVLFSPGTRTIVILRLVSTDHSVTHALLHHAVIASPAAQFVSIRWITDDTLHSVFRSLGFKAHSEHYTMQLQK